MDNKPTNNTSTTVLPYKLPGQINLPAVDKEALKEAIRQRVRNASVSSNTIFIPALPPPSINDMGPKNVAVYARVSTNSTEQVSSIENQTKFYSEKIEKTPNWTLQQIYSDEGKSGTSIEKRTEFLRMLDDASHKKMDLILCASVSRFARNVSDCIKMVRELKTKHPSHPVGVYFETENIYTLDPSGDQALAFHALLAEWESANKSRRMVLSYDQRISTGQYPLYDLLGYRHTKDGKLIIQEDEAITVRFIFLAYLAGYSLDDIAKILTEKQRSTLKGRTEWSASMVKSVMRNERRWGDLTARKRIVIDYVYRKTSKNDQKRASAFVQGHHDGIVTPEIAKAVKMLSSSSIKTAALSEINVITAGTLKGFVSISPGWSAINGQILIDACKSVYTEKDFKKITQEAAILNGSEHSKVMSMQFNNYEVPYGVYFMTSNTPNMLVTRNSLKFNKSCYKKLGECRYIKIFYHPIMQLLIIKATDTPTPNTYCWISENGKFSTTISSRAFSQALYDNMHWIEKYRFKFRGVFRERGDSKLLIFYLDEPKILLGKGSRESSSDSQGIQYIQHRQVKQSDEESPTDANGYAFPSDWSNKAINFSMALRQKRDSIINHLRESDLNTPLITYNNPLIGSIPTLNQVKDELSQLLAFM